MYFYIIEKMIVDQNVIKVTKGTAITCHDNLNPINTTAKDKETDLIIIDTESSSESSNNESDIEVVTQYKLEDYRTVIAKFGKNININSIF